MRFLLLVGVLILSFDLSGQRIKDFYFLQFDGAEIPVFVRGNLEKKTLILFVQGGPASKAIDFARADYPRWKRTLEKSVAIAYYDKRGLNQKPSSIDSSTITFAQYSKDIVALAKDLKSRYRAKIILMGHSYGAMQSIHTLANHSNSELFDKAILISPPLSTDFQPEIGNPFRLEYLENVADEFIAQESDEEYWKEVKEWVQSTDSLDTIEKLRTWNRYADSVFEPTKRRFGLHTYIRVALSRPYYLFEFFRNGDEERVSDLIWSDSRNIYLFKDSKHISIPTLALTGRFDDIAPPEEVRELERLNNKIQVKIIANAGHEPFLDQNAQFVNIVLEFLELN